MAGKKKEASVEYCLTDVLEMHYSSKEDALRSIKEELLSRPMRDSNLYPVPSFVLEDALVVIQDGDLKGIKKLYLLDSHRGSYRAFGLNGAE